MRRGWLLVAVSWLLACGGGATRRDAGPVDAATDSTVEPDAGVLSIAPPMAPAEVEPASMEPCAPGWERVETDGGAIACLAWPGGDPPDCEADEMALPGSGCERVGPECPIDGFPNGLPEGGVIFVRTGAAPGGDGTRARPFDRIAAGTAAARAGEIVAVGAGAYDEAPQLRSGVTLWGACATETIIQGRPRFAESSISVEGTDVVVRGITVGAGDIAIGVRPDASLLLADAILRPGFVGVRVEPGASLTTNGVSILAPFQGIDVDGGARLDITRTSLRGSEQPAIHASPVTSSEAAEVHLEDVAIIDGELGGMVLAGLPGSVLVTSRVAIARGGITGVFVEDATSTIEDVVVRSLVRAGSPEVAVAIALTGGEHTLRRVLVDDCEEIALAASTGTFDVDAMLVRGTRVMRPETVAMIIEDGTATMRHVHVEHTNASSAVGALGATTITASDLRAVDIAPAEGHLGGAALHLAGGAAVSVDRLHASETTSVAINVAAGRLEARDVTIERTRPAEVAIAYGIQVIHESHLELDRADISGSAATGLYVAGATARIADVAIRDTAGISVRDGRGTGLLVLSIDGEVPPAVDAERVLVSDAVLDGVVVFGVGASLTATDLEVDDVREARCAEGDCPRGSGGNGITCAEDAVLRLTRTSVARAAFAGLLWADRCMPSARSAIVRASAFGLLNDSTIDLDGALEDVTFEGNEVDFQTTELSVARPDALLAE